MLLEVVELDIFFVFVRVGLKVPQKILFLPLLAHSMVCLPRRRRLERFQLVFLDHVLVELLHGLLLAGVAEFEAVESFMVPGGEPHRLLLIFTLFLSLLALNDLCLLAILNQVLLGLLFPGLVPLLVHDIDMGIASGELCDSIIKLDFSLLLAAEELVLDAVEYLGHGVVLALLAQGAYFLSGQVCRSAVLSSSQTGEAASLAPDGVVALYIKLPGLRTDRVEALVSTQSLAMWRQSDFAKAGADVRVLVQRVVAEILNRVEIGLAL